MRLSPLYALFLHILSKCIVIPSTTGFELKVPIPGGKSISYNHDTGVLRIQTAATTATKDIPNLQIPPVGTKPLPQIINSIIVRDTGISQKGYGAFVVASIDNTDTDGEDDGGEANGAFIPKGSFLGFYEGDVIVTREALDDVVSKRRRANSENGAAVGAEMDYVMSVDGGVTFIDGYIR